MSPHKGECVLCGESRYDLNCPEIPDSWNNKEKTKMANFNEKINFGTGFVLCDPDNYFIYRSDSMRMFARKIYNELHSGEYDYRLAIQYKATHRVKRMAGHCFLWSCESANNGNVEVRMLDRKEDCEGIGDPRLDSIEGAIFIRDGYVYMYGDTWIDASVLKKEYVVCSAIVCGRLVTTFRIPLETFDRQFGLNENFPEQYAKPVKVETKNKCEQAVELIAVDLINEAKRNIESFKNLLDTNECQLERAMDAIKEALMDIDNQKCDLIDMLAKLDDTIRKLK